MSEATASRVTVRAYDLIESLVAMESAIKRDLNDHADRRYVTVRWEAYQRLSKALGLRPSADLTAKVDATLAQPQETP
jgi:hypothetical protein